MRSSGDSGAPHRRSIVAFPRARKLDRACRIVGLSRIEATISRVRGALLSPSVAGSDRARQLLELSLRKPLLYFSSVRLVMVVMLRALTAAATLAAAAGFTMPMALRTPTALRSAVAPAPERAAPSMAAIEPGAKCLVLGSGWIQLLTAKTAALAGYQTYVFTSQDPEPGEWGASRRGVVRRGAAWRPRPPRPRCGAVRRARGVGREGRWVSRCRQPAPPLVHARRGPPPPSLPPPINHTPPPDPTTAATKPSGPAQPRSSSTATPARATRSR